MNTRETKSILITGFEPFDGAAINPAWEIARSLPDELGGYRVKKLQIPTVFRKGAAAVLQAVAEERPALVLLLGQAGGRNAVTPETTAFNCMDARIADNEGNRPENCPVAEGGPEQLTASLPVRELTEQLRGEGYRIEVSDSAGRFVCNEVFYTVLLRLHESGIACDFVHVPYLPEQAPDHAPSMELPEMLRTVTRYLTQALEVLQERESLC